MCRNWIFDEDGDKQLFELIIAERLEIEEVEGEVEDVLKVSESVAAEAGVFVEEVLDLGGRSPDVLG